ncbi:MAG: hypothetical protein RLO12_01155 [Fulvivirga sp.]
MKKLRICNAVLLILILFISIACASDDPVSCDINDEDAVVETYQFFPINSNNVWLKNVSESESMLNLIIENQEDYEQFIDVGEGYTKPVIEFEKYTLLAGRIINPTCGQVLDQRVLNKCDKFYYEIYLQDMDCHAVTTIHYFALIKSPKTAVQFIVKR